ncbi:hypothetical protein [Actinomadura sp. GTD37]|uniref:hypothetical protein n=1 Tax=Actinomadura sp. GTD37 TaxID=1778030 RepID=UPI0035C11D0C
MPHHRLRTGQASAALVLVLAAGAAGAAACGPAEKAETTAKKATAPATGPAAAPSNGVEKLDAADILSRARKATAAARSLRIRGQIEEGGDEFALDFRYEGKAKSSGWFQQGGERVEITRIGKDLYIKGNDAFWKSIGGKGAVQVLSGKHLKTSSTAADFKDMAFFTDRTAMFNEAVKSAGTWKKGKTGTVGGTPTVTLLAGTSGDQIQVATRGEPYVLVLDGGPANRIEYAYEEPVTVERPPAGSVIDEDALE